jgi:histidine triad (HIT) family protein
MADDCLFCKLASGKMGAPFLHEDGGLVVVRDIHPAAKTHLLVIPKKHVATVNDASEEDEALIGRMVRVARDMAAKEGIAKSGYRLVFNVNADGGQVVFHIHLHVLGGQKLGRMG